jgi:hypothetical protein
MAAGPLYTEDELQRALALFNGGLSWRVVGIRMRRPYQSLCITANKYRKGTWAQGRMAVRSVASTQRIEELVTSGVTTIRGVARELSISDPAACRRLMRLGLDAEMRRAADQSSRP